MSTTRWTLPGLLAHLDFVHKNMPDHAYAWVLGAGASRSSGIPLAGDLVRRWLSELHGRLDRSGKPLDEWATAENLGIPKFDYKSAASSYSRVYEKRFGDNPDEGFAYLESLMTSKDPSPGYSILAQILDRTPHKVVISTNFDNLVADALSIYTATFPLVIGHESLASFVRVISRRPVICKIHRDLLLGPKNDHRSLRRLHESWAAALRALFSQYTPLFIGYGGNDDSLMDLLESLDPGDIKGQLIWCYYERDEPSERIVALVEQHRGALVPTPDFDLLMVQIGDKMKIEPIDDAIEKRAAERARKYRDQLIKLDTTAYPDARRILRGAFERAGGTLAWREKINTEPATARRKVYFEQALEQYPEDLQLQLDYAEFLLTHSLDAEQARARLEQLRSHDEELNTLPSYLLALLHIWQGRLDEAKILIAHQTTHPWKQWVKGVIAEAEGDFSTAEASLMATEHPRDVFDFFIRRGRFDEAAYHMTGFKDVPLLAYRLPYFQWMVRKDLLGARKLIAEQSGLQMPTIRLHLREALFALVTDPSECATALMRAEAAPKTSWGAEAELHILGLYQSMVQNSIVHDHLEALRRLYSSCDYKYIVGLRFLVELAETIAPKVPKAHRKFIVELAKAFYDPALRTGLNVYEIWRKPSDA